MTTLDPYRLLSLATGVLGEYHLLDAQGRQVRRNGNLVLRAQLPIKGITQGWQEQELADLDARIINAASIMYAESGGVTDAKCYNYDKNGSPSCSPTPLPAGTPGTERGVDRGLWQLNSVAWPTVNDMAAFDPYDSTRLAFLISGGFRNWGPWAKSKGMDPNSAPAKAVQAAYAETEGRVIDKGVLGLPGEAQVLDAAEGAVGAVTGIGSTLLGWAEALGRILSHLLDAQWWTRLAIGALGVVLVLIAAMWANRDKLSSAAGAAAKLAV